MSTCRIMNTRSNVVSLAVLTLLVTFLTLYMTSRRQGCDDVNKYTPVRDVNNLYPVPRYLRQVDAGSHKTSTSVVTDTLKEQRNALSRLLHEVKRQMGKRDCEMNKQKANKVGGWCKESSREDGGEHMTDMPLVKALSAFFKGKRVGSFGDGPGAYKRELLKLGDVSQYDAYDGAPYCEETSEGRVKFLDLTVPAFGLPVYDWVLSLEVAEHIPKDYESIYLDNLSRHCKEGLILSWAVPEQGGLAHINGQTFSYVNKTMEHLGFVHDQMASKQLQQSASFEWLRDNTNVFTKMVVHASIDS